MDQKNEGAQETRMPETVEEATTGFQCKLAT